VSVAAFISSQRTVHGVPHALTCRALGLSESWFYKWRDRPSTPRQARRAELADAIRAVFRCLRRHLRLTAGEFGPVGGRLAGV
jgi:putative transposase